MPETRASQIPDDLPSVVRTALVGIAVGGEVSTHELADAFEATVGLSPPVRDVVLGSLMTAVMMRGPVVEDVDALLRVALSVDGRASTQVVDGGGLPVVLVAGSGKKGLRTLNVSTPAALVAAAAGAQVIKVGSSATASVLGSRDLVRALRLPEHRTATSVRTGLAACGFAFVAVEPEIPILDGLYGGRFHAPNPFSFGLAVLASPVRGDITVLGLAHPRVDVAAKVLTRFGLPDVDVMTTRLSDGRYLDEIGPMGELRRCRAQGGCVGAVESEAVCELVETVLPSEVPTSRSRDESIECTHDLLSGRGSGDHRFIVCLNAAHLLVLGGIVGGLRDGMALANDVLRDGVILTNMTRGGSIERSG